MFTSWFPAQNMMFPKPQPTWPKPQPQQSQIRKLWQWCVILFYLSLTWYCDIFQPCLWQQNHVTYANKRCFLNHNKRFLYWNLTGQHAGKCHNKKLRFKSTDKLQHKDICVLLLFTEINSIARITVCSILFCKTTFLNVETWRLFMLNFLFLPHPSAVLMLL